MGGGQPCPGKNRAAAGRAAPTAGGGGGPDISIANVATAVNGMGVGGSVQMPRLSQLESP